MEHFIGRPSPLGNPFRIGRDGTRDEVIAKFRRWLWERLLKQDDARVIAALEAIKPGDTVRCFCKPGQRCHGEVVMAAARWYRF